MKRLPRLALAAALFAGALAGIPSLAFAGNLPAAIDGSVAVMHTNDIHGSYKYSYNESKVYGRRMELEHHEDARSHLGG